MVKASNFDPYPNHLQIFAQLSCTVWMGPSHTKTQNSAAVYEFLANKSQGSNNCSGGEAILMCGGIYIYIDILCCDLQITMQQMMDNTWCTSWINCCLGFRNGCSVAGVYGMLGCPKTRWPGSGHVNSQDPASVPDIPGTSILIIISNYFRLSILLSKSE